MTGERGDGEEAPVLYHPTLEEFALEHTEFNEKEFVEKYPHPFLVVNLDGGVPMLSGRLACSTTAAATCGKLATCSCVTIRTIAQARSASCTAAAGRAIVLMY